MTGVIEKTDELVEAIQQSIEYLSYNELKRFILREPGVKNRLDSFRRALFSLHNSAGSQPEDFEKLRQEYCDVLEDSRVMEYLSAEQALIQMMRNIYGRLGMAVTLDLDFPGEEKEMNI